MACPRKNTGASSNGFAYANKRWDEQMDAGSLPCKLDFLFDEAESESARGFLREWPPQK
jgi:hypothetical protein